MKSKRMLRSLATAAALTFAARAEAAPVTYHYDGDTVPTAGTYGTWFTTIGAGAFGYFPTTSWSSNGSVLTMNTVFPGNGIWFGHFTPSNDPTSTLSLANTASGNWVRTSIALSPGATDWSLYWYDASGFGSSFLFNHNGFNYAYKSIPDGITQSIFHPVADMTQFHTFTSYVLAGQVSYFFDNTYLGGGHAITGLTNMLLLGDGSGSTPTGTGSLYVDYLTVISAVGDTPPSSVPEPSTYTALAGLAVLSLALGSRRRT
jgi:MYXO-CTERM domain-containing protein